MNTNQMTHMARTFTFVTIFLASLALGYALVNQFLLDKPNNSLLGICSALFIVSIASWQRKKHTKRVDK